MKEIKPQNLTEPVMEDFAQVEDAELTQVENTELDENITFSIGIPIELMFDELKGDMLKNVKAVQKRLNNTKDKQKSEIHPKNS